LSFSADWSFPLYGLPKGIKMPFSQSTLYDAARIAVFYDAGFARLNKAQVGEKKHATIDGWGVGLRFNLPEDFSIRLDTAFALGKTPSDGKNNRTYISVTKKF